MSEVQHRPPPRGRGTARGGRGGFAGRGGFRSSRMNGDSNASSFEDQGEVGQLKQQYAESLKTVREMFPDWSDEDLVYALQEAQGDIGAAATRMSEGSISQWGEVKKKKQDRSRSKVPESPTEAPITAGRGRGRGSDIPRGSRGGRATDRGGRLGRGRGGTGVNGQRAPANDDSGKRDGTDDSTGEDGPTFTKVPAVNNVPAPPVKPTDTWAALLRPSVPLPAPKKVAPPPAPPKPPVVEPTPPPPPQVVEPQEPEPTPEPTLAESLPLPPPPPTEPALPEPEEAPKPTESDPEPEPEPEPVAPEAIVSPPEPEVTEIPETPEIKTEEPPVETAPQPLTEQNLEKVEDVAPAAPIGTQASTVNSSVAALAPATPRARHVGLSTPKISSARTASFTRRTLEQQEAVIMPGNHAIDRTMVQFGSLGLNGAAIDDDDYESEPTPQKPETVTQPPQSPPTEPVTVLPPAAPQPQALPQAPPAQVQVQTPIQPQVQQPIQPPVQQQVQPQISTQQQPQPHHQEALPTPRQAPGLPAQPQLQAQMQHQQQTSPQPPLAPQSMTSQHMNPQIPSQFNRFGGIEQTQVAQKTYDSFQQHMPQQHTPQTQAAQLPQVAQSQQAQQQSYGYPTHHQQQQHHQQSHPVQASLGGLNSLPDYTYYPERAGAPGFNYYNPYSQPNQDTVSSLPRAASGMGSAAGETPSQLPTAPSQAVSRFGQVSEQTSAHGTPSPGIPTLQPTSQAPNPQQTATQQQYPMQPYYHPAAYYYMNQVFNYDAPYSGISELSEGFSSYQQFYPTYQTTPFTKQQGLYTQPHQNFQYSDHTSSPAGLGGFGGPTTQGRDSGSGVSDYGRGGVSQAQQSHAQHSSVNFSGLPNFLNSRGLPEQQQLGSGVGQQQVGQQGQSDDNLKPFGDSKPPTGPASNAGLQGQPRPGSATSGANLPQQGSQPQGGMGYPHNLNHHLHGHQAHQQSQAQGQGYGTYSMYGQYPSQYQGANRQGASGWGGQYGGH